MIVSFSGLDGSGKSSCSDSLFHELRKMGFKVKKLYLGNYLFIGFIPSIMRYLFAKKYILNKTTSKKNFILKLWMPLFFLDSILYYIYLRFLDFFYDYVVTDRFFLDKIVSLNYLGYSNQFYNNLYINSFLKADIHFYLFNEIEILKKREINDQHSSLFYRKMFSNFTLFLNSLDLIKIKSNNSESTVKKILKCLNL